MASIYIKEHNSTGLKYLGYTTKDPHTYVGSGLYWSKHLLKHGNDVTTKVLFESNNKSEIKEKGLYYSNLYDVVNSNEFANLVEETGQGGITCKPGSDSWIRMTQKDKYNLTEEGLKAIKDAVSKPKSDSTKSKMSLAAKNTNDRVKCPHCTKVGRKGNMNRWHFDNCKEVNNGIAV